MRVLIVVSVVLSMLARAMPAFAQTPTPIQEREPNDSRATADTARLGDQVTGHVSTLDAPGTPDTVDYWTVHAEAGETVYAAIDYCTGCQESTFYIDLFRADGTQPASVRRSGMGNDPQLAYVAETSGWYFVRVRFGAMGTTGGTYLLTFRNRMCPDDPNEPNDSLRTATRIAINSDTKGRWCPNGDREFFRIDAHAGDVVEFWIDSVVADFYNGVDLNFLSANGTNLNGDVQPYTYYRTAPGFHNRYEVRTDGTFYVEPSTYWGTTTYGFQLHVRSPLTLAPGPGDPTTVKADKFGDAKFLANSEANVVATDQQGGLWILGDYAPVIRLSLDGTVTKLTFPPTDAFPYGPPFRDIGWDSYGNAFILTSFDVVRFIPPDRLVPFTPNQPLNNQELSTMAVRADGVWLNRYTLQNGSQITGSFLEHYDWSGKLVTSQPLYGPAPYTIEHLTVGPDDSLYYAYGDGIYRLAAGVPTRVLQHTGVIAGFTFDNQGDIYVADTGSALQGGVVSRVSLYNASGGVISDPFSWWPIAPRALAFGRDADGSPNRHLYALDRLGSNASVLELNPAGITVPGLARPTPSCPVAHDEAEPNDSPQAAPFVTTDTTLTGVSCRAGDQDYFRFVARRTQDLTIALSGTDHPTLELLAGDGTTRLAFKEGTTTPRLTSRVEAGKAYFVHVGNWVASPSVYTLQVGALTRPAGITVETAARELMRPNQVLNDAQRAYLDRLGNDDGRYDVGDFRAFLKHERAAAGAHQ